MESDESAAMYNIIFKQMVRKYGTPSSTKYQTHWDTHKNGIFIKLDKMTKWIVRLGIFFK
jgi:hypothetical protein